MSLDFFTNNWQSPLLGLVPNATSKQANFAASAAELWLFGQPPFSDSSDEPLCEGNTFDLVQSE
eukprot:SAG31_NODE_5393_length_2565_cov_1.959043_2_plen_64_part_00